MSTSRYEYPFDPDAENNTAATIFRLAREGGVRVLDVGSGPGVVSGALVHLADKQVTCLDLESDHLEAAAERGVQRTIVADLSDPGWADTVAGERFDVIIFADVLEHLVDPGSVLTTVRELDLLEDNGSLIVSIPNASHISIVSVLAAGDFPYRPTGLLDETHLRFFTLRSMRRLLEAHGLGIDEIHRTIRTIEQSELYEGTRDLDPELIRHLHRQHEETDTYQFILKVTPLKQATTPVEQAELEELRRRLRQARNSRDRAQGEAEELRARVEELERRIGEVYRSRTWRTGRTLVGGPAAALRVLRKGR